MQLSRPDLERVIRGILGPDSIPYPGRQRRPGMAAHILDLSVARQAVEFSLQGHGLAVIAADAGAVASVHFSQPQPGRDLLPLRRGSFYKTTFEKVWITNTAQPGKTLTLAVFDDELSLALALDQLVISGTITADQGAPGAQPWLVSQGTTPWVVGHGKTILSVAGTVAGAGDNNIVAAVAGQRVHVQGYALSYDVAAVTTINFESTGEAVSLWHIHFVRQVGGASLGTQLAVPAPAYLFRTALGKGLDLNLSGANTVHYAVSYWQE